MEKIGHKLLADNIDQQFVNIILAKLVLAVEKLSKTANFRFSLQHLLKEECTAVTELLYYVISFMSSRCGTPGMLAMGLTTGSSNNALEKSFLVICFIALKWSLSKLQSLSATEGWATEAEGSMERRVYNAVNVGSIAVQVLSALNYLTFLCRGDHPSLLYRLTGITMGTATEASRRSGGRAGYTTAQLYVESKKALWLALMGATAAASVTVDWRALRHYFFYYASQVFAVLHRLRSGGTGPSSGVPENSQQAGSPYPGSFAQLSSITNRECASCHLSPPEMPHAFECGHVYCYLCAYRLQCTSSVSGITSAAAIGTARVQCLQCYRTVTRCAPVSATAESTTGSTGTLL